MNSKFLANATVAIFLCCVSSCKQHSDPKAASSPPPPIESNQPSYYLFGADTVTIEGRFQTHSDNSVTIASAASNLSFVTSGTELQFSAAAEFEQSFIDVLVDGQLSLKASRLEHNPSILNIRLGENPQENHLVEIYNRGEPDSSVSRIIELKTQHPITPYTKSSRKLMFIGASVTCGAVSEPDENCTVSQASHNGRVAHGTLIARALNAESQLICRSGRGILNGSLISVPQDAVHFLDYIVTPPDGPVYWDHRLFIPDGVLISLGNNDDLNNAAAFKNSYIALLSKLRELFPSATILLTEGPLIFGERKTQLTNYLQTVATEVNDSKVSYIPSKRFPNSPCNDHPDAQTHEAIAKELLPLIKEKLGW